MHKPRYLGILALISIFYLALLVSSSGASVEETPIGGIKLPRPILFAVGPLAIWLTILATYGTMRMSAYGKLRLRALRRYVPSPFMDSPNFIDAVVFTPPPPWGTRFERSIARVSYPLALSLPWVEGLLLLVIGVQRGYFAFPTGVVLAIYAPAALLSSRCVFKLWASRICKPTNLHETRGAIERHAALSADEPTDAGGIDEFETGDPEGGEG